MVLIFAYPLSARQLLPQSFYLPEGQVRCSSGMKTSAPVSLLNPSLSFVTIYVIWDAPLLTSLVRRLTLFGILPMMRWACLMHLDFKRHILWGSHSVEESVSSLLSKIRTELRR